MPRQGKAWTIRDRYGDEVYLTWERWEHITSEHTEMKDYFDKLQIIIHSGRRRQHPLQANKYFYRHSFFTLPGDFDFIEAVVILNVQTGGRFVVTAYLDQFYRER
jgi:UDP-N-acetylenolpyruvoylglucosamine reductase